MNSDDYWREKQKEERRREEMYKALRERDYDTAIQKAAPDDYLDYLRINESQTTQSSTVAPAETSALTDEQKSLFELIECTQLDIHGRIRLMQLVYAVDLQAPNAGERLSRIRQEIVKLLEFPLLNRLLSQTQENTPLLTLG